MKQKELDLAFSKLKQELCSKKLLIQELKLPQKEIDKKNANLNAEYAEKCKTLRENFPVEPTAWPEKREAYLLQAYIKACLLKFRSRYYYYDFTSAVIQFQTTKDNITVTITAKKDDLPF